MKIKFLPPIIILLITLISRTEKENPRRKHPVKVAYVIDGDTVKLARGQKLRYIGVDTPETKHPRKPVQYYGKEAYAFNKQLVEGKLFGVR